MSLNKKLQKWVENDLISGEQSAKIKEFEAKNNNGLFFKISFTIVGLLIGWGICLIVASNWDGIPALMKIIGTLGIMGVFIWLALRERLKPQSKLKEMYLLLCFLMVAANIGLIGQIFNLEGGWHSFVLAWTILGLPYVFCSRSRVFNVVWVWLFWSGIFDGKFIKWLFTIFPWLKDLDFERYLIPITFVGIIFFSLLSYVAYKIDKYVHKNTLLAKGFALLCSFFAYCTAFGCGFYYMGVNSSVNWKLTAIAHILVLAFLAFKMLCAVRIQDVNAFKRNAFLAEIYIFLIFANCFGNLFATGIGFILGGLLIWLLIHILKKTSRYIKGMEIFND